MRFGERTRSGTSVSGWTKRAAAGVAYGVATGGSSSSITVSGQDYTLLTFTASGTLTVTKAGLFDVLLVGGGAGGGGGGGDADRSIRSGGGGGAGGIVQSTIYLDANQTVTIGAGGSGTNPPTNGNASAIGGSRGISVAGGGIGCAQYNASNNGNFGKPEVGASGGGGTNSTSATNSRTGAASMADGIVGKAGGDGVSSDTQGQGAGGGGGFTAVGGNASTSTGGAGGAGYDVSAFIAGSALYKAGGGGGGGNTGGAGGSSVGGAGGSNAGGSAASANTGGGGGGAGFGTGAGGTGGRNGGAGGSGIVYVRFKV